jgi:hypothetical protein
MPIRKSALKEFYCYWCGKTDFFKSLKHAKNSGWILGPRDFCCEKCIIEEREGLKNIRKK